MRKFLGVVHTHSAAHDRKTAVIDNGQRQGVARSDVNHFKGNFPVGEAVSEVAGPVVVGVLENEYGFHGVILCQCVFECGQLPCFLHGFGAFIWLHGFGESSLLAGQFVETVGKRA